ncbi:MAG: DUF3540 domain-containing protein [Deltaproteobacteria bacterium]|nr:DUF3540 domain-containing protein [Deltaproteobacteria bacterium]
MRALAPRTRTAHVVPPPQASGVVTRREGPSFVVRAGSELVTAERAVSCLVEPEIGDRVLLVREAEGGAFVLAVLRRDSANTTTRLSLEGDVALTVGSGALEVLAREGVTIASPKEVALVAGELRAAASRARTALGELVHVGASVLGQVDTVKLVGQALDVVVERSIARAKRAFRFVEESDTVRAGEIDQRAEGLASLRGEHAVVTAEKLVKVDGGQIHVG